MFDYSQIILEAYSKRINLGLCFSKWVNIKPLAFEFYRQNFDKNLDTKTDLKGFASKLGFPVQEMIH